MVSPLSPIAIPLFPSAWFLFFPQLVGCRRQWFSSVSSAASSFRCRDPLPSPLWRSMVPFGIECSWNGITVKSTVVLRCWHISFSDVKGPLLWAFHLWTIPIMKMKISLARSSTSWAYICSGLLSFMYSRPPWYVSFWQCRATIALQFCLSSGLWFTVLTHRCGNPGDCY